MKKIQGEMITIVKKDINIISLCRTTSNIIGVNVFVEVIYKLYERKDIIIGDLLLNDIQKECLLYQTI